MRIVKTTTEDGLKFTGFLSTPKEPTKRIVVHIHGMAGSPYENDWYVDFHEQYPENGCAFLVWQLRWTGGITGFVRNDREFVAIGDTFEIFEESAYDIDAWIRFARGLGYEEIILQTHSFWPSKVLSYLRDSPAKDVIAAVLVSPVDMFGYFQRKEGAEALFSEATTLSQEGKSDQILSSPLDGDTYLSARTLLNVFSPESGANVFCYTDRKHDWSVVNSVSVPVLLIGGTDDSPMETVRSTGESFKILSEQLRGCPRVHSKIYPWADHSFDGFGKEIVNEAVRFVS